MDQVGKGYFFMNPVTRVIIWSPS